jgi:cytochrome c-type biogenesis protein CcmE
MSYARKKLLQIGLTLVVIIGGIGYLFYSSAGEAFEYYKHVDEVTQSPQSWRGKHLQIHGFVVPGSILRKLDKERQQIDYKFKAINCGQSIDVHYAGTVPDTFKDGAEIVIKGQLMDVNQPFRASEISAKCPSKYQAGVNNPSTTMCTRGDKNAEAPQAKAL